MRTIFYLLLLVFVACSTTEENRLTDSKSIPQPFSIGEVVEIESEILGEQRTLNIYLPQGYHPDSIHTYPVVYLLDGSADEDFIHIAGLMQFANFPWVNMAPTSIVVGIANVDRKRDFTYPTTIERDKKDFPTTGGSAKFIAFLEKELQPYIEENYKTSGRKTIIGQSLGGLLATEILYTKPNLFDTYLIVSPSMWWDDGSILKKELTLTQPTTVFISVGKEGEIMEAGAKNLATTLKDKENIDLNFQFLSNENHANILHLAVYRAFEKLYAEKEH